MLQHSQVQCRLDRSMKAASKMPQQVEKAEVYEMLAQVLTQMNDS